MESRHRLHVAVVDSDGARVGGAGDPELRTFMRSAAKPFQALPLVEDGVTERFGFGEEEIALCCASHGSEERHVALVRRILETVGVGEEALACGPHRPIAESVAERLAGEGIELTAVHSNCSGKHAGMLALAVHHGWSIDGYERPDHPVQRRARRSVAAWADVEEASLHEAIDGCGVVTFGLRLVDIAGAFARLGAAATGAAAPGGTRFPEAAGIVLSAMRAHPFLVAGSDRLCTVLTEVAGDRVVAKTGAEGVYGAAIPERGLGVALKVEDGARRAVDIALVTVLQRLGVLTEEEVSGPLRLFGRPEIENTRNEVVGRIEAEVEL